MNSTRRPPGHNDSDEPFVPDFSEGAETGLYLALFELFDEGLIITGDEQVLEVNSAACRLLERDYRQIAGRPLAELFASEREFLDARARLFIQGETRGVLRVALPDGRHRDLRFAAAPRIRPGIHALILRPERSAAAGDAGSPDALWPRLAAALEQPVIVVDAADRVAAANAAALGAIGVARDELVGQPLEARLAVAWPRGESRLAQLKPAGRDALVARILPGPKPGWRLLLLPPAGQRPAPASPPRTVPAPDAPIERMFADSPLPTLLCDGPNQRIFAANAAAIALYGYPLERLRTMTLADLRSAPPGDRPPTDSGLWRHRCANGRTFDADIIAYPIEAPGRSAAMVVMHALPEAPRLAVETRLRDAVALDQLEVHFQPLVDAADGRVRGGEALMRWRHPDAGLLPFQRFAGIAHDAGLLDRIGDWILHAACEAAVGWPDRGPASPRVTVNIAIEQIRRGDLAERVRHALETSGLPGNRLELDLDEQVLNDDNARLVESLRAIRALGVQLAIDDFGRGVASIPRLRRYPLSALKLDPALVREVGVREDSEAIVEAITSMAAVLGLDVLARGVESDAQRAFLSALGCRLQQGPLYGRPMSADEFRAFLARQ